MRLRDFGRISANIVAGGLLAAIVLPASARAQDVSWSAWIALPDHYNGSIDVRFRVADPKATSSEIELRNRYPQQVRVILRLTGRDAKGDSRLIDRTFALNAGETADKRSEKVDLRSLENAGVEMIQFDGKPPKPTQAGFSFAAANLPNWQATLAEVKDALKSAEEDEKDANRTLAQTRAGAASTGNRASNDQVGQAGGATGGATVGQVQEAERKANLSTEHASSLRRIEASLMTHIREGEIAAAAPIPTTTINTPSPTSLAPTAFSDAAAASANQPTLNDLIATANQAAVNNDWVKVESTLKVLRLQPDYPKLQEPNRAFVAFLYANALGRNGKFPDAEASYREAVKLAPKNAAYQDGLAISLANQGKLADAEAAFQTAVKLEPENSTWQAHLKTIQDARKSEKK